jgi:hypothetical protein
MLQIVPDPTQTQTSGPPSALSVAEQIRQRSGAKLDPAIKRELAALTNLLPLLAKADESILNAQAQISADALLAAEPNIDLAKAVTKRLAERLRARTSLFSSAIRQGSPAVRVVLGLGLLLYVGLPLSLATFPFLSRYDTVLGMDIRLLGLVAFSGGLGSIVSIMVRLHQFSTIHTPDPAILFFTGLFKPIVGTAFALFIFAILSSGLLPVTIQPEKAHYFFAALSFVAGFSERFAQDVVSKTELAVVSERKPDA